MADAILHDQIGSNNLGIVDEEIVSCSSHGNVSASLCRECSSVRQGWQIAEEIRDDVTG